MELMLGEAFKGIWLDFSLIHTVVREKKVSLSFRSFVKCCFLTYEISKIKGVSLCDEFGHSFSKLVHL